MKRNSLLKSHTALCLAMTLVFTGIGLGFANVNEVYADTDTYVTVEGYASQWARSDLRAWMNGLNKENDNLPVDGSNGEKKDGNFLSRFTDAELALFQPETVTTNVFNDSAVLNSDDDDKALTRTTSTVQTKDRFWAASGLLMRKHQIMYEDRLVSADPGYDLSNYYTYKQKVKNGKAGKWRNIVPIPFWGGNASDYDSMFLRSPAFDDITQVLCNESGYSIEGYDVYDSWRIACACGRIVIPSGVFAAMAVPGETTDGRMLKKEIAAYNKLGKKNNSGVVPPWGMYLKQISLDNISGELTYDSGAHSLTFETDQALPRNKYLMVQVYKNWDLSKEKEEDGTQPETINARIGDTVFMADKKIPDDSTTSVTFTFTGYDIPDLSGYRVIVWTEQEATNDLLAQVSAPLAFSIGENGVGEPIEETKSLNPRVFAYGSDLSCSWGVYNNEDECTFISHGEAIFKENGSYEGTGATYQKLYIGTDKGGKPIEWWIAGRDDDMLTLYQCSGTEYHAFNDDTSRYEGDIKNPSLYLSGDFTSNDIDNFGPMVTLSKVAIEQDDASDCDEEVINAGGATGAPVDKENMLVASEGKLSLQFCRSDGYEWTDAPDGDGSYYVRAAFAGETIDGVAYAPCFSNVRKIDITTPVVYVTGVDIKKGQTSAANETIFTDGVLALSSQVTPDDAYNTNVKWSVSSGEDTVKLYQDKDCSVELDPTTEKESCSVVYVKALGSTGQATVTVTTVGLDSESNAKTKDCIVTVAEKEKIAAPVFSPEAGTYTGTQNITISDKVPGVTIYYTTDGSDPTTGSTKYKSPIAVSQTTTIKAFAVKDGMADSDVVTSKYTINKPEPVKTYSVTVITDNNGTASASPARSEANKTITLTAKANSGYKFKKWTSEDGITFANATSASTTFKMPAKNVTVKANFEKVTEPGPTAKDISKATVTGIKNKTYTGKAIKQTPIVALDGKTLKADTDYTVSDQNNKNVGTATIVITGKGNYTGSLKVTFKINKAKGILKVSGKTVKVKYDDVQKKKQTITVKQAFKITKKAGKLTYKKSKGDKNIKVSKTGKISVPKKMKKGTYKIKVKVTDDANKNYKSKSKTVTVTINIK